uniref:Uncharacterized protein n=1 Tax=Picea sitchensis TaxID=3332 RepID=A9P119_PICSI|nr:unknown [Picea sitchensis]
MINFKSFIEKRMIDFRKFLTMLTLCMLFRLLWG